MADPSPPPTRRFQAVPIEETVKKVRRFAPEPVETTTRSNKKEKAHGSIDATISRTDFAGKGRFLPTPVETTFKSSKQVARPLPTPEPTPTSIPQSPPPSETPKPRRRFAPELIETTKRSKKAGDARPATLPTDKTDLTPGVPNIYTRGPKRKDLSAVLDELPSSGSISPLIPPRRQGSMRPHCNSRRTTRGSSFHPELESIKSEPTSQENSEEDERSDGDSPPSLSDSIGSSEDSLMRLQLARTRESCDDRFSGYLLELAAKAAEKQLQEQALAAFPNESFHEIVEHFYDREIDAASEDESVEGIGMLLDEPTMRSELRRKSTEVGWAVKEMQQHQDKLNRLREEETNKKLAAEASKPTFKDPFWTNGMTDKSPFAFPSVPNDKEAELRCMRSAASPPMLGADLKFRMCPSPKATKFESDQPIDIQPNRSETGGGLWGGYCVTAEADQYLSPSVKGPTLIHTPQIEREDPFSSAFANELPAGAKSPRTKDSGVRMLTGIDERLKIEVAKSKAEDALLNEFDDSFVTQVYNYLSLGYPSLAHQYDEELARISHIPQTDLRSDDSKKNAKGYIATHEPFTSTPDKITGVAHKEYCARWKALRVYILEWARQHPSLSNGGATPNAWGVRARRGSWAI